jgi:hypothetical protein
MMNLTFESILEKVVHNKNISRRDKLNALRTFIKANSGENKPKTEKDIATLAELKAIKQTYTQQEANEKLKDKMDKAASSSY